MALDNTQAVVEALLFASDKPLMLEQIRDVLDNLTTVQIRKVIEDLNLDYEAQNRGMRVIEVAGGFRLITPVNLAPFLKKFYKQRKVEKLSKPSLETLAIIAYKQPVTKLEIELLRNVNVDGVVESLLEKGIVRVAGRKNAPGRPLVFATTRQFLEHFGLKSLEDLPKMEDFLQGGKIDEPQKVAQ